MTGFASGPQMTKYGPGPAERYRKAEYFLYFTASGLAESGMDRPWRTTQLVFVFIETLYASLNIDTEFQMHERRHLNVRFTNTRRFLR